MSNVCNLCGSEGLEYLESFLGADNVAIKVATCGCCQSLIPEYAVDSSSEINSTLQQVKFHEDWWDESNKEELDEVLSNVKNLVSDLQKYLGPNDPDNLVLELGAGRGSLLRALLDKGYSAYGCEPAPKLVALARQYYGLTEKNLFEVPGGHFLDHIVPSLPGHVQAFVLWHVLEHLENPMQLLRKLYEMLSDGGCLILQLPIFCQQYIYPEHYFFPSHATFDYIAKDIGFQVEIVDYDLNNFFVTICFRKTELSILREKNKLAENMRNMSAFSQAVFLRDEVIRERERAVTAQTKIINEKVQGMDLMESLIQERDKTISAQTALIDEQVVGMDLMESLIQERDKTISAQTALIDEKVVGMGLMESLIQERDKTISAQTALIAEKVVGMSLMTAMIDEREKALEAKSELVAIQISELSRMESAIKGLTAEISSMESVIKEMKVAIQNANEELDVYRNSSVFKAAKLIRLIK
ncbi:MULTISPECIES: bifunctional 2-polyprenyl-6-hydroxyphenol methylase/3-demethylubiquinol 3-O-methyltransferase UbiG [Pseudomonas]|uniref:class I SAM-dependent methyltransferase n=1 Tax=Pseudomonas TaxID=286 RepID=UPI0009BB97EB|nr:MULTISPECIES: class I SAM-dependent methyltransferase [Pseudomonas]UUT21630.1 methyltransferase domain-containing protein [Pseudomonas sp. T8]